MPGTIVNHPGLAEIPAPDGSQEVMSKVWDSISQFNPYAAEHCPGPILHPAIVKLGNTQGIPNF